MGDQKNTKSRLAGALRSLRSALAGIALFSGVINILMLGGALFMMEVYDRVLPSRSLPTLAGLSVLAMMVFAALAILEIVRGRMLVRVGTLLHREAAGPAFQTVWRLPLLAGRHGDGQQPLRDLDTLRGFLTGSGPAALLDLPWLPIYLGTVFLLHPALGLTALAGMLALVGLTLATEALTREPNATAGRAGVARNQLAEATARNAEVVATMGLRRRIEQAWHGADGDYLRAHAEAGDIIGGFASTSKVFRLMLQSALLAVGAWLVIGAEATAGIILAGSIIGARALAPVDAAIAQWRGFMSARQAWRRLDRFLSLMPEEPKTLALPAPGRSLEVVGLAVTAPGGPRLLVRSADFRIEAGKGVALLGPSGSGKSTLLRALAGAWMPARGRILLDGADLGQWPEEDLGRHIGYLPQDVELFDGTVAENIARFDQAATAEAVVTAAQAAGVHDTVLALPDGYQTRIGADGEALSAGQRQRIALARALYGNPFLVILDEPNSNLDAEGEQALAAAISSVTERGGIVLVASHRQGLLSCLDQAILMRAGAVEAVGAIERGPASVVVPARRAVKEAV